MLLQQEILLEHPKHAHPDQHGPVYLKQINSKNQLTLFTNSLSIPIRLYVILLSSPNTDKENKLKKSPGDKMQRKSHVMLMSIYQITDTKFEDIKSLSNM